MICDINFNFDSFIKLNIGNAKNLLLYKPVDIFRLLVFDLLLSLYCIPVGYSHVILF